VGFYSLIKRDIIDDVETNKSFDFDNAIDWGYFSEATVITGSISPFLNTVLVKGIRLLISNRICYVTEGQIPTGKIPDFTF